MECPNGVDQGVHTTHKEIDIVSFYYKDENVPKIWKIILHPLSPMMQTYAFGDGFVLPSYNYDTPRIRACKLFGVQGQSWKRRSSVYC
jgi:hypothetical protein